MTGGWRELLANSVKIENLAYTGQAFEILEAVEVMANSITGLPDELVFAHKMGWRMFGWGGTLAVGAATDAIPVVKTSIELLPPAPFRAFVSALLGLVQLSQADPEGNEYFARAFLITIPHPMIADQMLRGLGSGTEGVNSQAVLDVLAQTPYMASVRPQVLAARSSFAIRRINEFPEDQRVGILTAALADGATALDLLERNWEPVQVQWRDHLKDLLVGAVNTVEGPVHAENARRGFDQDKPIRQNATLHRYAPNIGGPSNSVPIIASTAPDFDLLEHEIKKANANTTDTLNSLLATIPDDQLHEALRTLPDNLLNPYRVFVACGLIRESKRRGVTEANFVSGDWRKFRLKRAELDLCAHDSIAGAQAELASICGDSAFPEDLRARAHVISDGIGPMNTMDAYLWAQDWLSLIEKDNNHRPHIFHLIKRQVADAPTKSEVAVFLNNPDVPPMVRMNHHYNIGVVQMETGDDTSAEANFTKVIAISDAEMSVDDVFRYVAESHRFGIWWRQARLSGDPETKLDTYQRVLTYARERVETLQFHDELRINLARWGWNAAVAMGDDEAAEMFKAIATSEARTKLF